MGIFRIAWKTWNISWESDCENIDSSWFIYISAWGSSADSMAAMTEGSSEDFRSQVSDLWTDASTALGRPRGERASRKKIKSGQKGRRVAKRCVFQCLSVPKGRKVGWLYKAAGAGPSGGLSIQKVHTAAARSTCRSQIFKAPHVWSERHFSCQAQWILHLHKSDQTWGFCSRETFEEDEQRRFKDACRMAGAVQETSPSTCLKWGHFGMILLTNPHLQCLQLHLVTLWWRRR